MTLRNSVLMVSAGLALSIWTSAAMAQVKSAAQPGKGAPQQPSFSPTKPAAPAPAKPIDPNAPQPQISFDKTSNDFGVINDDNPVNTEFKFTNKGAGDLLISQVQGSCGCTVPALEKKDYAPGESGTIKVTYNPHGRRGKQQTTVTVTSNDPLKPTQILELHSEIKPLMMLEPQVAQIGQVQKGKSSTVTVLITSRRKELLPTQATASSAALVTKLLEPKEATVDGETVTQIPLEISVAQGAEVGQISGQVTIRTSDQARLLNLSVMGEIVGDVEAKPQRIQLSAVEPGAAINTTLQLVSRSGKPFKVEKVEEAPAGPKMLNVAVSEDKSTTPPAWNLTITGTAPPQGAFRGDIVVTTDIPDEKTVKVQYYGFVRAQQAPGNPGLINPTGGSSDPWLAHPSLLAR